MILPDINLLVYAYNEDAPLHRKAKPWWSACPTEERSVALPWTVLLGYLRLMTSRSVLISPLSSGEAIEHIRRGSTGPKPRSFNRVRATWRS